MDLNVVLRTSLLLVAACVASRLLRRAAPSTRHLLWHAAIVMVLLAPALAPLAPKFNVVSKPNDWNKTVREQAGSGQAGVELG